MLVRRCAHLLIEPRERLQLDLETLFAGDSALRADVELVALAAHLEHPVVLDPASLYALLSIGETLWQEHAALCDCHGSATIATLLEQGLLISDAAADPMLRKRDESIRDAFWHPLSAVYHAHSRWRDGDTRSDPRLRAFRNVGEMVQAYGEPPAASIELPGASVPLPAKQHSALRQLADQRWTCRNFDPQHELELADLAAVLDLSFGVQESVEVAAGARVLKKRVPSGGSLHPVEAFVLCHRVRDLSTGLYHYAAEQHALVPVQSLSPDACARLALEAVAGQEYFADAPVQVFLVARFLRNFWKYRRHVKALRAIYLDAGHLSQMVYLAATELGLGAFITAAINEHVIGEALQLDTLQMGPIAVAGFGRHQPDGSTIELRRTAG